MKANLPKKGAWIMIIKTVPIRDVFAPLYSIWYALPTGEFSVGDEDRPNPHVEWDIQYPFNSMRTLKYFIKLHLADKKALDGHERTGVKHILDKWPINRQAKILTPFGTVKLNHNEFNVIDFNSYLECINNGSFQVKFLNKTKAAKNTAKDQIFYIRSRGISLSSALGMVSGIITSQNTLYMLPHPEYQKMFLDWFDRYHTEHLVFKHEQLKKNPECIDYFFNMEEASKINQQYYKTVTT